MDVLDGKYTMYVVEEYSIIDEYNHTANWYTHIDFCDFLQ